VPLQLNLAEALVVKRGNLFLVTPRDGDLPEGPHPLGLWYRDCRFLSVHRLRLDGEPPLLLQASDALGTRALHDLTDPGRSMSLRLERTLEEGVMVERIDLRNHRRGDVALTLDLRLDADFAPMLEVRGLVERPERPAVERVVEGWTMRWSVHGRDGVLRTTAVEPSEPPAAAEGGALRFELELPAGGERALELRFAVEERGPRVRSSPYSLPEPVRVRSDDELFERVLGTALLDLQLLRSELDGQPYFAAGIPWYATLFGRDSLIAAMQTLPLFTEVAEGTLRLLGSRLGREVDDGRDEEPGKVLHELRVGEPAALGETPFARYHGTADATPLWLCLLGDHADWAGGLDLFRELRPQVEAALGWIARYGDLDGDGLVEYRRRAPHGLENHGWRDSPEGVPDAAGRPLAPPVALVEVQGYVAVALRRVARLFEADGEPARGDALRARAGEVEAALERFWVGEAGGYAIGLDGAKARGSALTSNQGHLLWAGALAAGRAAAVRDLLTAEPMFSGWGVRTLGEGEAGFNPVGYHNGSVWPHDNAMIACGMRRYGFDEAFMLIFEALLEAASLFPGYRLPELFGGYARRPRESPVPYPVACRPQAWAAGSIPCLLARGLGLRAEGLDGRLRIVRPALPRGVDRIELAGLRVGRGSADLRFERRGGRVELVDARVEGRLEVVLDGLPG
jgi:glycogen debranching enzyme